MKNLQLLSLSFILLLCSTFLSAQKNWKHLSASDGLASDTVYKVLIEDESNIWIATEGGLSHYDGSVFTNYTSQNSQLPDNRITDLEWAQNKLWLLTDAGLSSFDGTSFQNFTSSNGLLSNNLTDIASTSDGTVWAASLNGVVRYDGTQFLHDSAKVARAIEADSSDRIYILLQTLVGNVPNVPMYEVYDGISWSSPAMTNFPIASSAFKSKFFKSNTGQLFLIGRNQARYAEVQYPFNLVEMPLSFSAEFSGFSAVNPVTLYKIDDKIFISNLGDEFLLNTTNDSILTPFVLNDLNDVLAAKASDIDSYNDLLVIGTFFDGILLSDKDVEPLNRTMTFEVNQIRTVVRDHGPLFNNMYSNSYNFEFPKDSNSHGIYSADFVVVAKEANQSGLKINAQNPFLRNNNPGPISDAAGYNKVFMAKVNQQEIAQHKANFSQPSYTIPQGITNWPAIGDSTVNMAADLAPFFDANSNGCYDPENGDYPIIKGDEAIYWINHNSEKDFPLEYHYMLYGFNRPNDVDLNQTVFLQYRVINRGSINYDSVKVGFYFDGDLGNAVDDYVGCDSLNNIGYVYNGDLFDQSFNDNNGYGANPPALGVKHLSDSMTNFIYYSLGTGSHGDPRNASDWNNYLNSRWKNGVPLKYGGNGVNSLGVTNVNTNFMFTGSPFPQSGWTEANPGGNQFPNNEGDRRFVTSIPYFSLNQGASKTIEIAIGYGRKVASSTALGENVPEMVRVLNHAKTIWDTISQATISYGSNYDCSIEPVGIEEITQESTTLLIYPNPSSGQVFIKSDNAIQALEIYNINGQLLRSETMQNQLNFSLDFSDLNNGLYFIRLQDAENKWQMRKVMMVK